MATDQNSATSISKYKKRNPLVIGVFLILGTFVVTLTYNFTNSILAPKYNFQNQTTNNSNGLDISASSSVDVVPTKASITIGVTVENEDLNVAKTELDAKVASLKQGLLEIGLTDEEIQTNSYNVYPIYDWEQNMNNIIGYNASMNLALSSANVELINQAIDVASENEITNIGSVQFNLDEDSRNQAEKESVEKAYQIAKTKAQDIAQMAGLKLGKINSLYTYCSSDSGNNYNYKSMSADTEGMAYREASTDLEVGSEKVNCNVSVNYALQ